MKKTLIAIALTAAPAFAGAPMIAPAPVPAPAPKPCPYALEIGGNYNFAAKDIVKHELGSVPEVDTWGVDLTGIYNFNENHSVNLRFGYNRGCASLLEDGLKQRYVLNNFSLMPGYRYTHPITEATSFFIGGNVGIMNESLKLRLCEGDEVFGKVHDSDWGFAYSAEAGFKFDLCPRSYVFVAYEFTGNTAKPKPTFADGFGLRAKHQIANGVRAGLGMKF